VAAVGDAVKLVKADVIEAGMVVVRLADDWLRPAVEDVTGKVVIGIPVAMLMTCVVFEQSHPLYP